jgi:SAM-dependent methyltransferase
MDVTLSSFENFNPEMKFDVAISVMVFEHINNPEQALKKIVDILGVGSSLLLIVGNLDYYRLSEGVEIQEMENNEIAVKIERPQQILYDIARPISNYIKYAESAGLKFLNDLPMLPTEDLIKSITRYEKFKDMPLTHLLIFKK